MGKVSMSKKKEEKPVKNTNFVGMMAVVMLSVLFVLIGTLMLFLPDMQEYYFAYVAGGAFLLGGLWLIVRYFWKEGYRLITNYDFAFGMMLAIFGIAAIVKAKEITGFYNALLAAMILIQATVLLQYSIQMKALKGRAWWLVLIFAVLGVGFTLLVILDPRQVISSNRDLFYGGVMTDGILGLISLILATFRTRGYEAEQERERERILEEGFVPSNVIDSPEEINEHSAASDNSDNADVTATENADDAVPVQNDNEGTAETEHRSVADHINDDTPPAPPEISDEEDHFRFFSVKHKNDDSDSDQ